MVDHGISSRDHWCQDVNDHGGIVLTKDFVIIFLSILCSFGESTLRSAIRLVQNRMCVAGQFLSHSTFQQFSD